MYPDLISNYVTEQLFSDIDQLFSLVLYMW